MFQCQKMINLSDKYLGGQVQIWKWTFTFLLHPLRSYFSVKLVASWILFLCDSDTLHLLTFKNETQAKVPLNLIVIASVFIVSFFPPFSTESFIYVADFSLEHWLLSHESYIEVLDLLNNQATAANSNNFSQGHGHILLLNA